jgi:hypothetical protein
MRLAALGGGGVGGPDALFLRVGSLVELIELVTVEPLRVEGEAPLDTG